MSGRRYLIDPFVFVVALVIGLFIYLIMADSHKVPPGAKYEVIDAFGCNAGWILEIKK